jgi:methionine biosynthesis protein MetW
MRNSDLYLKGYGKSVSGEDRVRKLLMLAGTLRADRLLDIGCGDGALTVALQKALRAREVFGLEISPEGSALALHRGVCVKTMDVDGEQLPFPDSFFDAVYAGEILEHLYDPDKLLDEIYRVLRSAGFAIIDTPNLAAWHDRLSLLFGFQPHTTEGSLRYGSAGKLFTSHALGGGGHLRILTLRAFLQLMKLHGFSVKHVIGASGRRMPRSLPPAPRLLFEAMNRLFSRFPSLSTFLIALVEKPSSNQTARLTP